MIWEDLSRNLSDCLKSTLNIFLIRFTNLSGWRKSNKWPYLYVYRPSVLFQLIFDNFVAGITFFFFVILSWLRVSIKTYSPRKWSNPRFRLKARIWIFFDFCLDPVSSRDQTNCQFSDCSAQRTPAMTGITESSWGSPSEVSITTSLLVMGPLFVTEICMQDGTGSNLQLGTSSPRNAPGGTTVEPRYLFGWKVIQVCGIYQRES